VSYAWFLAAQDTGSTYAHDASVRGASELKDYQKLDAYITLADMYANGADIEKNLPAAAKWYRQAAQAGSLPARVQLASMMVLGSGIPQDFSQARTWCAEAAKEKYAPGAFCLGLIYRQGLGVAKDFVQAAKWFNRAADQGHVLSAFYLGEMYSKGEGEPVDKEKAYTWMLIAATGGIHEARQQVNLLQNELDSRQLKRAEKKAVEWQRQHALPGLHEGPPSRK
jgi:TPR repeat protein